MVAGIHFEHRNVCVQSVLTRGKYAMKLHYDEKGGVDMIQLFIKCISNTQQKCANLIEARETYNADILRAHSLHKCLSRGLL